MFSLKMRMLAAGNDDYVNSEMGEESFEGHNSLGDYSKPKLSPLRWDKVRVASDRGTMWDTCVILLQVTKFQGGVKCRGIALGDSWSSLENFVEAEHENQEQSQLWVEETDIPEVTD
ncbi:hypothetical protein Tco_1029553 [Tanacetum coccineum]|uniref:Uncharacterized protein n=1 Tax=Tanacetum coccineum TaxID=301880 RepID=A0ABQ5G604_9ASTR